MTLLVLVALGLLSALALLDAAQAARLASLGEDEVFARAALVQALDRLGEPPDLAWLCLQPPARATVVAEVLSDGRRIERRWWMLGPGVVRVEVIGVGVGGARHRRIGWMRPDSLEAPAVGTGCPGAQRLVPLGPDWLGAHPEG
jgi:hypothetical protein